MILYLIRSGTIGIYSIGNDDSSAFKDYFDTLDGPDRKRLVALVKRLADTGQIRDEQKFRNLGNGVWELKTPTAKRVYCFWSNRKDFKGAVIITHGTEKRKPAALKREKKKVIEIINEFKTATLDIRKQ